MKNIKCIIICVIIALLILLIILIFGLSNKKQDTANNEVLTEGQSVGDFIVDESYKEIESPTTYYTVKGYIEEFFKSAKSAKSDSSEVNKLLNILDKTFINQNSITSLNINESLSMYIQYDYNIVNIYQQATEEIFVTYLVECTQNSSNNKIYIFLAVDNTNGTYKIYPTQNSKQQYANKNLIEQNSYNSYKNTTVDNEMMCKMYFEDIIKLLQTNTQKSYKLLNEEYKNKKFKSIEDFYEYVDNNNKYYSRASISSYKVNIANNGNREYIIVDKCGNYYIIIAESVNNYNVMLDSYTVPLTQTTQKYNESTTVQKACICIETIKEMINTKDYNSIYSHLNNEFKLNNYETVDYLEKFIKDKFYENNKFEYKTYQKSTNNYIVNVKVFDCNNDNNSFEMTYVIKLGNTINDFEVSFSEIL